LVTIHGSLLFNEMNAITISRETHWSWRIGGLFGACTCRISNLSEYFLAGLQDCKM